MDIHSLRVFILGDLEGYVRGDVEEWKQWFILNILKRYMSGWTYHF